MKYILAILLIFAIYTLITCIGGLGILLASYLLFVAFKVPMLTYFQCCVVSFVLSLIKPILTVKIKNEN